MRFILTLTIFFFSYAITNAQTINQEVAYGTNKKKLIGKINKKGLTAKPYAEWFNKNHDAYIVNEKFVNTFKDNLNQYKIKVFLGTWCGDSKKEVPRFYKLLETANYNMNNLEVIALDREKEQYKQGPNAEEKGFTIHRVPTFIFYKDDKEVNRIVEHPKETLERDVEKIVTNKRYFPKYYVANLMFKNLDNEPIDELKKLESNFLTFFPEYSEGTKELNTLGYWHLNDKQYDKAIYIFDLNTKLFPYNFNTFDSLGEAYFETKNYTEALKNYYKVLSLKPDETNALEMIEKIKTKTE